MEFHPAKCKRYCERNQKWYSNTHSMTISLRKSHQPSTLASRSLISWWLGINPGNKHKGQTNSKANCKLGLLCKTVKLRDQALKEKASNTDSIVRPTLQYCSTTWDPFCKIQAETWESSKTCGKMGPWQISQRFLCHATSCLAQSKSV